MHHYGPGFNVHLCGLLLAGILSTTLHAQNEVLSIDPFADLVDLNRLTHPLTGKTGQTGSYDRTGGNGDASFWYYLRGNKRRAVMADVRGPGVISRIWVTAFDPATAQIEIFIDGSATPAVSASMSQFFGNLNPFVPPLAAPSTGSWVSYVPIPFERSCRVEAIEARPDNNVIYYNVTYRQFPPGEPIGEVFQMPPSPVQQTKLNQFAQQWTNRSQDPKTPPPGQQTLTGSPAVNAFSTATLANIAGAGTITGIRLNLNPTNSDLLFNARIRAKWDGSSSYAINSPIGAFFGSGYGPANAEGLPLGTKNSQMYCYFPMPYSNGAVIELVNQTGVTINSASYTITYVPQSTSQVGRLRFHADARSLTPAGGGSPSYRIMDSVGTGHYLGCVLAVQSLEGNWGFLEGDEEIYVDGETMPSIQGTGAEDYFNGGFYFLGGTVSFPFHGCSFKDDPGHRMSAYRLHVPDPVVFRNGIIVDIQHGGVNEANANYYSTAFFYRDDQGGSPPDVVNAPLTPEPVTNGGFENGFGGHNGGEANGWIAYQHRNYYGITPSTFSAATDQKTSGTYAQKVVVAPPGTGGFHKAGIAQQVQVTRGVTYEVTGHLRLSLSGSLQPGDVVAQLGIGPKGDTYYDDPTVVWADAPTTLNTWHTVSAVVTAETDYLGIFAGGLRKFVGISGTATVWIDDVSIDEYDGPPPPPPLPVIENWNFEQPLTSIVWPMWVGSGGNSDPLERDYHPGAPAGEYVLAVKGFGGGGKGAYQYVPNNWQDGHIYRLGVRVKNIQNSGIRYAIGYRTGNAGAVGATSATYGPEVIGNTTWQQATVEFTYTGTQGVTLYLKAINAGSSERAGFDAVTVEELTPPGPPTITLSPASITRVIEDGQTPANSSFNVRNTGGSTLNYTITDNAGWLSTSPSSGSGTGESDPIAVNYNVAGLAIDTHHATITVSDPAATNNPQTIPVTLTILPASVPADFDGDGDVDGNDYARFQTCLSGDGAEQPDPNCLPARMDGDDDVDTIDLSLFMECLSGANVPGDAQCAD